MFKLTEKNDRPEIILTPVNIVKGTKKELEVFLHTMCERKYFVNDYDEVITHFAFQSSVLSESKISDHIVWGNVTCISEILRFCYFLRDSKMIKQYLPTIWMHFSYKNNALSENLYSLAAYANKHFPDPYNQVLDPNLRIILKKFYESMN
jgi:hypothetical protein